MDIISFQLAAKALKKVGSIGRKKVDDTALADNQVMVYSASEDKYVPKTIYTNVKDWTTGTKYFKDELVYLNGVFYKVVSEHTSSFIESDLSTNKIVKLDLIQNVIVTTNEFISLNRETKILANTNFELPLNMAYKTNSNQLMVQLNNNMLIKGVDWIEVDDRNIKFLYDIDKTWSIVVRKIGMDSATNKAQDISILDAGNHFNSTNVEDALSELFQNVNNGKQMIATAIVDKGGQVTVANTFEELSMAISTLSSGGSSNLNKKTIDYPNKKANDIEYLLVTEQLQSADQIILTMYKFVPEVNGTTILVEKYEGVSNFNTFDTNIFEMVDNKLQTKRSKTFTSDITETFGESNYYKYNIDLTNIENIEDII